MEAEAVIYTGKIVTTLIGNDIVAKAISDVTTNIYNLLYNIVDNRDPVLDKTIEELDIKVQIQTINSMINNITPELKTEAISLSLHHLHDIICKIREDLKIISNILIQHSEKYFSYFRSVDYKRELKELKNHKKILDTRLDLFVKLIKVEESKNLCRYNKTIKLD